ncbi:MAG: thiamine pyrophosphate-dependent dehydrogenase E1 component subunit alpha [Chloroflexi bacterium]|nr:thiamine pyrophosphate-dependent dehydrogenase E1 component subunit alpha [Chloroflexota bacterium]
MTELIAKINEEVDVEPTELVRMYRSMLRIRHFDGTIKDLFTKDFISGPTHTYIGEEAVAVGAMSMLTRDDYIISTHRGHGHCIAKGGDVKRMMAELLGKATGYCKGKGGSMHIADFDLGILGANGIVAAGLPIAVGAALALQMDGNGRVILAFSGDAATNNGAFHEALNLASVWKLPVVFVWLRALHAITTRITSATAIEDLAIRASSYGMEGVIVDGNDVLAVRRVVGEKVAKARAGGGPTLVECKTYRWFGHVATDPGLYRGIEEIEIWKAKDPIARFRKDLVARGVLTDEQAEAIDQEAAREIEEAIEFGMQSPEPDLDQLLVDIYG